MDLVTLDWNIVSGIMVWGVLDIECRKYWIRNVNVGLCMLSMEVVSMLSIENIRFVK